MNIKRGMVLILAALMIAACGNLATQQGSPNATTVPPSTALDATTTVVPDATAEPANTSVPANTAAPSGTVETVARVDAVILTRADLDARIDRIEKGFESQPAQGMQLPSRLQIEEQIVNQFIDQNLLLGIARDKKIAISEGEIDNQIKIFDTNIAQSGETTLDQVVQNQLGLPGSSSTEFRQFVSFFLAQERLGMTLVPTDTVQTRVTEEVLAQAKTMVEKATVAHILVATEEEANQVLERLDKGEKFEDLARELSTDPGSAQNGGVYENIGRGEFVPEFEKAMFEDLQPGEVTTTPVQTQFGYHIIKLISRNTAPAMTDEQAQQTILQRVDMELQQERQQALSQVLTEAREQAIKDNRLQQPAYPTPTPDPAFAVPEQPAATPVP